MDKQRVADKRPGRVEENRAREIDLSLSGLALGIVINRRDRGISVANIFLFQVNKRPRQLGGSSNRGYG